VENNFFYLPRKQCIGAFFLSISAVFDLFIIFQIEVNKFITERGQNYSTTTFHNDNYIKIFNIIIVGFFLHKNTIVIKQSIVKNKVQR